MGNWLGMMNTKQGVQPSYRDDIERKKLLVFTEGYRERLTRHEDEQQRSSMRIKVRMTARDFKELMVQAASNEELGHLVLQQFFKGRCQAHIVFPNCGLPSASSTAIAYAEGKHLHTIHED